jgi:hypothetical protein
MQGVAVMLNEVGDVQVLLEPVASPSPAPYRPRCPYSSQCLPYVLWCNHNATSCVCGGFGGGDSDATVAVIVGHEYELRIQPFPP